MALAAPSRGDADEPWKRQCARVATSLAGRAPAPAQGLAPSRYRDLGGDRTCTIAVRTDTADVQLINVFANTMLGRGCRVAGWDREANRFADLAQGGVRERKRCHAGMYITAVSAEGRCSGQLQLLLQIKEQQSSDGTFARKFVHVIWEASAPACCAARHRRNRLGGDFFPALIANYHRSGATQFDDGEAPEGQPEASP